MDQMQLVAFDEHMTSSGESSTATSSDQDALTMGMFDQISFTVTAEQIEGSNPALQVQVWHSADGVNWMPKSGIPEVPYQYFSADGTNVYVGFDDGSIPSLRYIRFVLTIMTDAPGFDAAVRIDAVLNDTRENEYARKMQKVLAQQDANACTSYIQGGSSTDNPDLTYALNHMDSSGPSLWNEISDDGSGGVALAADSAACVAADGTVTITSPRGEFNVPTAIKREGDC
jgi:hypothetical protein